MAEEGSRVEVIELVSTSDERGLSYPLGVELRRSLNVCHDIHVATIRAGHKRGNHFHTTKREIIFVLAGAEWELFWDEGEGSPVQRRHFSGHQSVLLTVMPGASHAVVNRDQNPLVLVAACDQIYSPSSPDAVIRNVVEP